MINRQFESTSISEKSGVMGGDQLHDSRFATTQCLRSGCLRRRQQNEKALSAICSAHPSAGNSLLRAASHSNRRYFALTVGFHQPDDWIIAVSRERCALAK
jgi:hypothetical protein